MTCLYYGVPVAGGGRRLSALAINAHFLPGVVFGWGSAWPPCPLDPALAVAETLEEIGGFIAFVDCLADGYAMGAALRARRYRFRYRPSPLPICAPRHRLRDLWQHELRWARTIRSIVPLGYAGSILAILPWALLAVLSSAASPIFLPAIAIAGASIVCRMALLRQVERAYALPPQAYWLVPACDLFSFILLL